MSLSRRFTLLAGALLASLALQPYPVLACAACYGQSDSPMAQGMNWGIMSLLGIIGLVLVGVASFFVFLSRRAVASRATGMTGEIAGATDRA